MMNRTTGVKSWTTPEKHEPAAATKPTCTHAAESGKRHIVTEIGFSVACLTTKQTPIAVRLYDGAATTTALLQAWKISAPADACVGACFTGLEIACSTSTAPLLEFSGNPVAGAEGTVYMNGITKPV